MRDWRSSYCVVPYSWAYTAAVGHHDDVSSQDHNNAKKKMNQAPNTYQVAFTVATANKKSGSTCTQNKVTGSVTPPARSDSSQGSKSEIAMVIMGN